MAEPSPTAFLTIGALAEELGLPQHILRYWETRFPQLRPLQRAGNRRYYRPEDADLARRINRLLNQEGYTVKGVQKLLAQGGKAEPEPMPVSAPRSSALPALKAIRDRLSRALVEDDMAARV
jgi:DNA-binding transcriptional MerR regulator